MNSQVVVGNGWSALLALAQARVEGVQSLVWVKGSAWQIDPPLESIESTIGSEVGLKLAALFAHFQIDLGSLEEGSWFREYKNRSFREASCERLEGLWEPERTFVALKEVRFSKSITAAFRQLRIKLEELPETELRVISDNPVQGLLNLDGILTLKLASGEVLEIDSLIYADLWTRLSAIEGLPKPISIGKRTLGGILQVVFSHRTPIGALVEEGFALPLHRESGDEREKHGIGSFSRDGLESIWTLCLDPDEAEDNHVIGKKLKRLKTALERAFVGAPFGDSFLATVQSESVRFSEAAVFLDHHRVLEPQSIPGLDHVRFLTDGYGLSAVFSQFACIASLRDPALMHHASSKSQAEDMNFVSP